MAIYLHNYFVSLWCIWYYFSIFMLVNDIGPLNIPWACFEMVMFSSFMDPLPRCQLFYIPCTSCLDGTISTSRQVSRFKPLWYSLWVRWWTNDVFDGPKEKLEYSSHFTLKKESTHLILIDHPKEKLECLSYLSECSCII